MPGRLHRLTRPLRRGWGLWRILAVRSFYLEHIEKHGAANYAAMQVGRRRMRAAASRLPAASREAGPDAGDIHFLTGEGHWHLTAFCARSLLQHTPGANLRIVLHDDGTLAAPHVEALARVLPRMHVVWQVEEREQLETSLPAERFPVLRERRFVHPFFRKLHIWATTAEPRLYLDSDMLFYRRPEALLAWLRAADRPCHLIDAPGDFYGYDRALLASLTGSTVPAALNTGVVGMRGDIVDWERLEFWAGRLADEGGVNAWLEQVLTAMALAGESVETLARDDYQVTPDRAETLQPRAVMHHYTGTSRAWYYRFAWRRVLRAWRKAAPLAERLRGQAP
jgi:hypothetical protein